MVRIVESEIRTREVLGWEGLHVFHHPISSCSQKLRIFLDIKGLKWESHVVDLAANANMEEWYLGINPRGLVPALVHDGEVHIESNDILKHLEMAFPEPCLIPGRESAEIDELLHHEDDLHLDLRSLSFRFVFNPVSTPKTPEVLERYARSGAWVLNGKRDRGKEDEMRFWLDYARNGVTDQEVRTAATRFRAAFDGLERRLASQQHLMGDALTVLDIAWFIYVNRLSVAGYPVALLHPRLHAWFRALQARPEFAAEVALPPGLARHVEHTRRLNAANSSTLADVAGLDVTQAREY
jgi:glutathione S-transferase